jgi:hypothetical protein
VYRLFLRYRVERTPARPEASTRCVKDVVPLFVLASGEWVHVTLVGLRSGEKRMSVTRVRSYTCAPEARACVRRMWSNSERICGG